MKDGIINLNKPEGITSNDVLYKLKSILGIKKLGHTGTLDPLATGVLPICINKSTRVAEYLDVDFKTYRCTMILGVVTDTFDVTGEVIEDNPVNVVEKDVIEAFKPFNGLIEQMPPMYSAVRINGRKLYDVMRTGTDEEIKIATDKVRSRQIYIKNVTIEDALFIDGDSKFKEKPHVTFTVECSKGTYIRTICNDVGKTLGCGATMEVLTRIKSGIFTIENSVDLDELIKVAEENDLVKYERTPKGNTRMSHVGGLGDTIPPCLEKYIFPSDYPLEIFGIAYVSDRVAKRFVDGWHLSYREIKIERKPMYEEVVSKKKLRDANPTSPGNHNGSYPGLKVHPEYKTGYKIYRKDGLFLGVAFHNDQYKKLVADKIFVRVDEL